MRMFFFSQHISIPLSSSLKKGTFVGLFKKQPNLTYKSVNAIDQTRKAYKYACITMNSNQLKRYY